MWAILARKTLMDFWSTSTQSRLSYELCWSTCDRKSDRWTIPFSLKCCFFLTLFPPTGSWHKTCGLLHKTLLCLHASVDVLTIDHMLRRGYYFLISEWSINVVNYFDETSGSVLDDSRLLNTGPCRLTSEWRHWNYFLVHVEVVMLCLSFRFLTLSSTIWS